MASLVQNASQSVQQNGEDEDAFVFVYDRRAGNSPEVKIQTGGLFSFETFKEKVCQAFGITESQKFVITTTNREEIHDDATWDHIECGDTLYVLERSNQELPAPAQERVNYLPHYDTIVKGGMYEYYASEGQNPLPYAFAELIDNALAATAYNIGSRKIQIRLLFDEANPAKNCIVVVDNGKGMTSKQLNNWAIYRLSKFIRKDRHSKLDEDDDGEAEAVNLLAASYPRSLNSDISYFGVGGKQAIFFVGNSTRMITKPKESKDVHELTISKEEFERKEKNRESIYSGYIRNRKPADSAHIIGEEENVRKLIAEEEGKESFTAVVIHGISPTHVTYLKSRMKEWTRQLAHIYHYYIHGPNGNVESNDPVLRPASPFKNIDIEIMLFMKGQSAPKVVNLRDIDDDMQSQYIRTSGNTFEFKAVIEGTGVVEGVLRYHPFLYDRETYPSDANDMRAADPDPEDDHDYTVSNLHPARGRRAIFECYWNGRLIPYTSIDEFDWCSIPKKPKAVPVECYNRISGVLWTNDKFQVSTNKLTFIDLEMKLRDKNTAYYKITGKTEKRTAIDKEFTSWLKECHEQCDKQVKFSGFSGHVTRGELPRNRQSPWSVYTQIDWDGKVFKKGNLVRITKTVPILYGTVTRFLLYGDHEGDVFATGGDIEVVQEPRSLYDEVRLVPLSKLDRQANEVMVKKFIEEEEAKLPDRLIVSWPEGDSVAHSDKRPAGKTIGAIKVEIANRKGELISKLPGSQSQKKLLVELKVIWHSPNGDEVIVSHISQHGKTWPYWFRKMENIKNLGSHTLQIQAVLNETGAMVFAGKELPSHRIRFTVTEAEPDKFTVGLLDGPFRMGAPFQIPLEFQDEFNNPTKPTSKIQPVLEASGLSLSYDGTQIKGNTLIIKGIVAKGNVQSNTGKNFNLVVKVPGLEEDSQHLKIRMLPGPPKSMTVTPADDVIEIENGSAVSFSVQLLDEAGNVTSQPKLSVVCKFSGSPSLPVYTVDCSSSGGGILTGEPINIKIKGTEQELTAKIDVPSVKGLVGVEKKIKVTPSTQASGIEVTYLNKDDSRVSVKSGSDIVGAAGEMIQGIEFKLLDEAGREKPIEEKLAAKVKVNWTPKLSKEMLLKGCLPDIKVPNTLTETKYCLVSLTGLNAVEASFTVKSAPGDPAQIKCRLSGSNKLRLGEKLAGDILINVTDKHGNEIKRWPVAALKDLQVSGEGLVVHETERALEQTSGFLIRGIKFEGVPLGSKEVCVRWRDFTDYVRLQMVAGPPSKISLPGWDLSQPVTIYNETKLRQSLLVQLCDDMGNATPEPNIKVQVAKDPGIKLMPATLPTRTDNKGIADFGHLIVAGKRGVFEIQPKAFVGRTTISGPKIKISIQPDPTKPVSLTMEYDKNATYTVGGNLPDFTVKVLGEDESLLSTAKPSCLNMKLWQSMDKTPGKPVTQSPDARRKNDLDGMFYFKNRRVPEQSGMHNIQFIYKDGKHELTSNVIVINVQPGAAVKLVPNQEPGTPTVSNTRTAAQRSLIRNLRLELRDAFDNPTGFDVCGKLQVEITHDSPVNEVPQLVGNTRKIEVPVVKGQANIQNLMIQENTPGKDGQGYILRCRLCCPSIPRNQTIPPYDIPFLFYNDAKKQAQMQALTKERDSLCTAIKTYKSLFETTQQLINELKISLHERQQEETRLKNELRKLNIPASQLQSVSTVDNLMKDRQKQRDQVMKMPRRMCGLQPAPKDPDVLGKIAHLAQVSDHAIARVLSWHMSADMDCVVTITTRKAKEIYKNSQGKQQVLPLDSIYKKNLPDWNKPLPHVRIRPNWRPGGNPVYARNLLTFQPEEEQNCKVVFGMLLGDTIILDTLDDANSYRQEIVKHTHCPTILTREGDRIRSNGKFGGLMNKALPLEKLRGVVFSEPLSPLYNSLGTQIDLLQNFKNAMTKRKEAEAELQEHLDHQKDPEMVAKQRECQEAEDQLHGIENKLGFTPSPARGQRRAAGSAASEEPAPKRGRSSTPMAVNGSASPATPTRQSLRRLAAAAESPSEEGRKRGRRN